MAAKRFTIRKREFNVGTPTLNIGSATKTRVEVCHSDDHPGEVFLGVKGLAKLNMRPGAAEWMAQKLLAAVKVARALKAQERSTARPRRA